MHPKDAMKILNTNLPKGFKYAGIENPGDYDMLEWMYTDNSGDKTTVVINFLGVVTSYEETSSSGNTFGTEWPPETLDFLWRASRILRDLPWG